MNIQKTVPSGERDWSLVFIAGIVAHPANAVTFTFYNPHTIKPGRTAGLGP